MPADRRSVLSHKVRTRVSVKLKFCILCWPSWHWSMSVLGVTWLDGRRWWRIHLQVSWTLCSTLIFNHLSSFTHSLIKGQISAIKATIRAIFYQLIRWHGITILISFLLCWMPVAVVGVQCSATQPLAFIFLYLFIFNSFVCIIYYTNMHILWPICMYPCKGGYSQDTVHSLIPPSLVASMRLVWSRWMVSTHRLSVMTFFFLFLSSLYPSDSTKVMEKGKYDIGSYIQWRFPSHHQLVK